MTNDKLSELRALVERIQHDVDDISSVTLHGSLPLATSMRFVEYCGQLTNALTELLDERERRGIAYPRFCCDGHENIGHLNEKCPLCEFFERLDQHEGEK